MARAAVVGTGFVGLIHVEALRRLGVEVAGVCASTPESGRRAAAALGVAAYETLEAVLADTAVDVVHLATPNHLHHPQAKAVLAAGKHCVCEKPLALDAAQSAELVALAEAGGLVHCTNFNNRFYPQCQEARARVLRGDLGAVWNVHGSYLQDWLLLPTDWSWRLEPERGGELRAVADIGSHWLDLAQFVTGRRVEAVFADLATVLPTRERPAGDVQTFARAGGEREPVAVGTEDLAHVLLRLEGGARGSLVVSQVSAGRKNSLRLEVDGAAGALGWDSEAHEQLWLGHRERANEILWRDPSLLAGPVRGTVPGGHPEGFQDAFKHLYRAVYEAVEAGRPGGDDAYPTFRAGHRQAVIGEAILASSREQRWMEVAE